MDIFITNPASYYQDGIVINNIEEVLWVERYLEAGEFSIKCEATKKLKDLLVPGTFLSHNETSEIMMVESQIIDETKDGEVRLEVSGRSLEAIVMENRIITNLIETHQETLYEYQDELYPSFYDGNGDLLPFYDSLRPGSWGQVKYLIDKYITGIGNMAFEPIYNITYDDVPTGRYNDPKLTYDETFATKLSNLYTVVKDLLSSTNSGIKVTRTAMTGDEDQIKFVVHQGQLKENIVFSVSAGDLESVRYLWQFNPWFSCHVDSSHAGFKFPTGYSPASGGLNPSGGNFTQSYLNTSFPYYFMQTPSGYYQKQLTTNAGDTEAYHNDNDLIISILRNAANIEVAKNQKPTIIDAKANANPRYKYKIDYDIGDLVYVAGGYEASSLMRVVEHAQFLDNTGETSIPTFAPIF